MERCGRQHSHLGNNRKKEAAAAYSLFQLDFVPREHFAEYVFIPLSCQKFYHLLFRQRAAAEGEGSV